ncbi:MAG TPA: hypothetical protein VMT10_12140 [Solirubrobacteraceae bacterium]|nr:hypothetical protein [Solirubrobacteraceae bacterium]
MADPGTGAGRSRAAGGRGAAKGAAKRTTAAGAKKTTPKATSATRKPRVATKPAQRRSKRTSAARSPAEASRDVALFDNLGALGELLAEHVVVTVERLHETLDDAVRRGRMLPDDAAEIAQRLSQAGRRQVDELLAEAERRLRRLR